MKTVGRSRRTPRASHRRILAALSLLLLAGIPSLRAQPAGTPQPAVAQASGGQASGAQTGSSGAQTAGARTGTPSAQTAGVQTGSSSAAVQPAAPAIQVTVNGSTVAPGQTISVAPTPLANTSDPLVVTITNIGDATLRLDQYAPPQLYGDASMMYLLDTSTLSSTIDPGKGTSFSVTFFPYQTGADDATLVITSNDPSTPKFAIDLSGNGLPMSDQ